MIKGKLLRMDNVLTVVDDLESVKAFFIDRTVWAASSVLNKPVMKILTEGVLH